MGEQKRFDVVCVGTAAWDVLLTGIDRNVMNLDGQYANGYFASSGGAAVNAAISMSRLGINTAVCVLVGEDSPAGLVLNDLELFGVNTEYVIVRNDVHTASPVILVDESGDRHILRVPDNGNQFLSRDMISDEMLMQSRHLHLASANVLSRLDGEPLGDLFHRAHELGLTTSMDASHDKDGRWIHNIESALHHCDIFFPSLQEASEFAKSTDIDAIFKFFSAYPIKIFGIKMGENGAMVTDFKNTWKRPTLFKEKPTDTTGAGDAFLAAFVAAWLKGYSLPSCLDIGSAHVCSVLHRPGANRSAGTWEDMKQVLRVNGISVEKL